MTQRAVPPPADLPESTLGELHALYRADAVSEPSAVLDHSILAAARADLRATSASSGSVPRPWWKAWLRPASVMAVAVLGLSLTWQVVDQQERDRRQEIGSARDQPDAAAPADQGAAAQPPAAAAPADKALAPAAGAAAPADLPARVQAQAAKPAVAAEPRAFPAQEEAAKSKAGAASGSVRRETLTRETPAPSAPAMPAEKKNLRSDEGDARAKTDRSEAANTASGGASGKLEARRRADGSAAEADALGKSADEVATPQAWLKQIRDLRTAGREAEAAQSLARFRVRYPDFVLPDDLNVLK
jgi:hypothetical protein